MVNRAREEKTLEKALSHSPLSQTTQTNLERLQELQLGQAHLNQELRKVAESLKPLREHEEAKIKYEVQLNTWKDKLQEHFNSMQEKIEKVFDSHPSLLETYVFDCQNPITPYARKALVEASPLALQEDVKNYFTTRDSYLNLAVSLHECLSSDDARYAFLKYDSSKHEDLLTKLTKAVQDFTHKMKDPETNWLTALLQEQSSAKVPLDTCQNHASPIAQIASDMHQDATRDLIERCLTFDAPAALTGRALETGISQEWNPDTFKQAIEAVHSLDQQVSDWEKNHDLHAMIAIEDSGPDSSNAWEPEEPDNGAIIADKIVQSAPGIGNNCFLESVLIATGKYNDQQVQEISQEGRADIQANKLVEGSDLLHGPTEIGAMRYLDSQGHLPKDQAIEIVMYRPGKEMGAPPEITRFTYREAEVAPGGQPKSPISIFYHRRAEHFYALLPQSEGRSEPSTPDRSSSQQPDDPQADRHIQDAIQHILNAKAKKRNKKDVDKQNELIEAEEHLRALKQKQEESTKAADDYRRTTLQPFAEKAEHVKEIINGAIKKLDESKVIDIERIKKIQDAIDHITHAKSKQINKSNVDKQNELIKAKEHLRALMQKQEESTEAADRYRSTTLRSFAEEAKYVKEIINGAIKKLDKPKVIDTERIKRIQDAISHIIAAKSANENKSNNRQQELIKAEEHLRALKQKQEESTEAADDYRRTKLLPFAEKAEHAKEIIDKAIKKIDKPKAIDTERTQNAISHITHAKTKKENKNDVNRQQELIEAEEHLRALKQKQEESTEAADDYRRTKLRPFAEKAKYVKEIINGAIKKLDEPKVIDTERIKRIQDAISHITRAKSRKENKKDVDKQNELIEAEEHLRALKQKQEESTEAADDYRRTKLRPFAEKAKYAKEIINGAIKKLDEPKVIDA